MGSSGFAEKIQANTERFRSMMTGAGFVISGDNHPISPVMLGDARLANQFANELLGNYNKYKNQFQTNGTLSEIARKKMKIYITMSFFSKLV